MSASENHQNGLPALPPISNKQIYVRTPLIESVPLLAYTTNRPIYLKLENCQPSGSFKLRGISAQCKYAHARGFRRMICSSGGNAGLATAFVAARLGLECHIVVFKLTPVEVCDKIRSYGASVEMFGDVWDEAYAYALSLTEGSTSNFMIHPFNHPELWAGHSTMIDEIAEDLGAGIVPSLIVTCCGGGGLTSGIVQGVRRQPNWSAQTKIVVMETHGSESFNVSVQNGGQKTQLEHVTSIVGPLVTKAVCDQILDDYRAAKPQLLSRLVSDRDAVEAAARFANEHRMIVGLACGATLAALYTGLVERLLTNQEPDCTLNDGPIVVIVCGGSEMSFDSLIELRAKFSL